MKIINSETFPAIILGCQCDHCGARVEMGETYRRRQLADPTAKSSDAQQGLKLSRYVSVDIVEGGRVGRLDMCPTCAAGFLRSVAAYLPRLRSIGETQDGTIGLNRIGRSYRYHAIDAETDRVFEISSFVDDGA
ncbi:hypothetical protein E4T66_18095 [Sinimarinibacterium sp. CAU 1509]|uniref:hypothetical protein n=1 Tax=Sinimarinibacterium sp. CAU 1509 TaxID=2562283 RepID=UPI0010AD1F1B|nr:hypothetical protein [Sinimarinibacterium sp. CAU 1509]TJY57317.1 hypothetical protein E4T66_18095 [Sinimarinibacterium sp. CAU 1509]